MRNRAFILIIAIVFMLITGNCRSNETETTREDVRILIVRAEDNRNYDMNKAFKFAEMANTLSEKNNFRKEEGEAKYQLGIIYSMKGDYKKAEKLFKISMKIKIETDDMSGKAVLHNALGQLYRLTGQYSESIKELRKSIDMKEVMGQEQPASISYNNLGLTYIELSDYPKALEYCERAYQISKKLKDTSEMINSGTNIANIYYYLNNYDQSLKYYQKILYLIPQENLFNKSFIYNNIANVYLEKNEIILSEKYFGECLDISETIGNDKMKCTAYLNLGNAKLRQGKFKDARIFLTKSRTTALKNNDSLSMADADFLKAALLIEEGKLTESIKLIKNCLNIYLDKEINSKIADSYNLLSTSYAQNKDYSSAYEYQLKYNRVIRQVQENESGSFIAALQMKTKAENELAMMEKEHQMEKAQFERTSLLLIIIVLFLLTTLVILLVLIKRTKELGWSKMVLERKVKNHQSVYFKLSRELKMILFGISVDIMHIEDKETFNKFSATFNRLSKKYNELIDTMKLENDN